MTVFCGGSRHLPYLTEPILKIFFWNLTVDALLLCGLSISAGFPLHQDVFHIIFDNGIGLIGLPQNRTAGICLKGRVGYLVPEDRV